jgi:hypothetical protein
MLRQAILDIGPRIRYVACGARQRVETASAASSIVAAFGI